MSRIRLAAAAGTAALVTALTATVAGPADAAVPARSYPNCSALNHDYPHGVGKVGARDHVSGHSAPVTNFTRSNAVYAKNTGRDGDHDGVACEHR